MNTPARISTYAGAGVNIEAGNETVQRIKPHVQRTFTPGVLTGLGGFGALFQHDFSAYLEPILVSGTDGVGTKLKLAFALEQHETVGIDLVAMCANDILCSGARPLFFLDYFATGKLSPEVAESVVKGIAEGCIQAGCALVGGETAELPGFYEAGEYDLAGFCVGVVDKPKIIDGSAIAPGDVILGVASSGLHSNGYSLARRVLEPLGYNSYNEALGTSVGAAMIEPTRIYVRPILSLLETVNVKGMAHITGGGFYENIPRVLRPGLAAIIERDSWPVPPLFHLLRQHADIAEREMFTTFNMGIGLVLIVNAANASQAVQHLSTHGLETYRIGTVTTAEGEPHVVLQ